MDYERKSVVKRGKACGKFSFILAWYYASKSHAVSTS